MPLALEPVQVSGVNIRVEGTTVFITGSIYQVKPGDFMGPFIKELHQEIIRKKIKLVNLDITALEHLNSSGIREIVNWILMLDELNESEKYYINIIYTSRYLWQESSISTFAFLNSDRITKEVL